jgi:hypothetical protein
MSSASKAKFDTLLLRSDSLSSVAGGIRKKSDSATKTLLLHAALATQVAAWEVYVKGVAGEYFAVTTKTADSSFSALHELLQDRMKAAAKKLNTPNSFNSREFLMTYTGFDPWSSWTGAKFGSTVFSNALLSRSRLDEILALRHSFAHGFTMPAHIWNVNTGGAAHLDCRIVGDCGRFFSDICHRTDSAFSNHIHQQHAITKPW